MDECVNLVERVYRSTRAQILDGTYPAGMPLRLNALASSNQMSLIPVREALRMLESERLVVSEPNKGARVAPLSMKCMEDLYRIRSLIEAEAVRLATPKMDDNFIEGLGELIERAVGSLLAGRVEQGLQLHRRFHFSIYELTESDWMLHMVENLWAHSDRYIQLASGQPTFVCSVDDNHHAIVDHLKAGDGERAATAMEADIHHTVEMLRDELSGELADQVA